MNTQLNNKAAKDLFKALASLETAEECKKFMRDLCTLAELGAMAERWQVVQQIDKKIPYRTIAKNTGSSTATITRIAHWLNHGTGGYRLMLKRLSAPE
ncbi:transposase [Candidatus Peregrinibacteria bacterium CG_4_9_14_0_2_um_filter_53_11]|nr:MAG: transposase [Candidatus Peregrinibacteria bacterium CG_4_9_14_0_2_um_filter_53_11]